MRHAGTARVREGAHLYCVCIHEKVGGHAPRISYPETLPDRNAERQADASDRDEDETPCRGAADDAAPPVLALDLEAAAGRRRFLRRRQLPKRHPRSRAARLHLGEGARQSLARPNVSLGQLERLSPPARGGKLRRAVLIEADRVLLAHVERVEDLDQRRLRGARRLAREGRLRRDRDRLRVVRRRLRCSVKPRRGARVIGGGGVAAVGGTSPRQGLAASRRVVPQQELGDRAVRWKQLMERAQRQRVLQQENATDAAIAGRVVRA
mmetsp:Transcript_22058/g.71020  ORF Transcript_22058/g.71020 Transcript_22058/m.71020 type:complete len:266 (-) Transcript_22058:467-1264(-)